MAAANEVVAGSPRPAGPVGAVEVIVTVAFMVAQYRLVERHKVD